MAAHQVGKAKGCLHDGAFRSRMSFDCPLALARVQARGLVGSMAPGVLGKATPRESSFNAFGVDHRFGHRSLSLSMIRLRQRQRQRKQERRPRDASSDAPLFKKPSKCCRFSFAKSLIHYLI
jgi:hypothetical protein